MTSRAGETTPEPFEVKSVEPKCPECGYDLRTLTTATGARCPECGCHLPFDKLKFRRDRAAERHYKRPRRIDEWWPVRWTWAEDLVVLCVMALTVVVFLREFKKSLLACFLFLLVLLVEIVTAHVVIVLNRRYQLRRYNRRQQRRAAR